MTRLARFLTRDWLIALVCLGGMLWLCSRNIGFSNHYHADESGKLDQLMTGRWNFNHPMLTLMGTRVLATLCRVSAQDDHGLVVCGRWLGVIFTSLAGALLVLAAHRLRGPWVAWGLVPLLWFHAKLFHYAHYLKEDPGLLLGICGAVFAAVCYFGKGRRKYLELAGLFCGLAASAKYIGVMVPLLFVAALWLARPLAAAEAIRRGAATARVLVVAGLVFVVVNAPMLGGLATVRGSLGREVGMATDTSKERADRRALYLEHMTKPAQERLTYLLGAYLLLLVVPLRRPRNAGEFFALAFLGVYTATILLAPKTADRYLLPYYGLGTFFAMLGLGDLALLVSKIGKENRWARAAAVAGSVVVLALAARDNRRLWRDERDLFANFGGRLELAEFIRTHLPRDSHILYSVRVGLPDPTYPQQYPGVPFLPQKVEFSPSFRGFPTIASLRAAGVTHVVLTGKEEDEGSESGASRDDPEFYRDLFGRGKTLWREKSLSARTAFPTELILVELPPEEEK